MFPDRNRGYNLSQFNERLHCSRRGEWIFQFQILISLTRACQTAAAVLWSLIHLILLERKRPVHPGFSVAFDLIAMGITLAFGILDMVAFSWVYNGRRKYFARRALGIASATLVIVTG